MYYKEGRFTADRKGLQPLKHAIVCSYAREAEMQNAADNMNGLEALLIIGSPHVCYSQAFYFDHDGNMHEVRFDDESVRQ